MQARKPSAREPITILVVFAVAAVVFLAFVLPRFESWFPNLVNGPVDVHLYVRGPPASIGIADYGVVNDSNHLTRYKVDATQVVGHADVYSIEASNSKNGQSQYVAGLQLNTVVQVNSSKGTQAFWLQNIVFLDTRAQYLNYANEINNFSDYHESLNANLVVGKGITNNTYAIDTGFPEFSYKLPLSLDIITNVTQTTNGIVVDFSYRIDRGASLGGGTYDSVLIKIADVRNAAIVVDGNRRTGSGYFYSSELVYGGPPGGKSTTFAAMNSTISLGYLLKGGAISGPRAVWEFGITSESASNLRTDFSNNQFVVTIGRADFNRDYILNYTH